MVCLKYPMTIPFFRVFLLPDYFNKDPGIHQEDTVLYAPAELSSEINNVG